MCGFVGLIYLSGERIKIKNYLIEMNHCISHRGPDDEGYLFISGDKYSVCGGKDTQKVIIGLIFIFS